MLKNYTIILGFLFLLNACGSSQKAEQSLNTGNYDKAFNTAVTELTKDKYKKSNQKLIPILKSAYDRANTRDLQEITNLQKNSHPDKLKKIYALYMAIDVRQDEVINLQPLYYDNKEIHFDTKDYTYEIKNSLRNYSDHLYSLGTKQLAGNKMKAREAHKTLSELEYVNPSYTANLGDLVQKAKEKGSSFVLLKLDNQVPQSITTEHIEELTRISEANMKNKWVIYHNKRDWSKKYDYEVAIRLKNLQLSPEQVNTETVQQQARVKDGWEYEYDGKGNVAKDSLGNDIKREKFKNVRAEVLLYQQLKTGKLDSEVIIKNFRTNAHLSSTPLSGGAKFENIYGKYQGDTRAIEKKYYQALKKKELPYPTDSEFVKYALADIKQKMLKLLNQQQF